MAKPRWRRSGREAQRVEGVLRHGLERIEAATHQEGSELAQKAEQHPFHLRIVRRRQAMEATLRVEQALGDEHVEVHVELERRAEALGSSPV